MAKLQKQNPAEGPTGTLLDTLRLALVEEGLHLASLGEALHLAPLALAVAPHRCLLARAWN